MKLCNRGLLASLGLLMTVLSACSFIGIPKSAETDTPVLTVGTLGKDQVKKTTESSVPDEPTVTNANGLSKPGQSASEAANCVLTTGASCTNKPIKADAKPSTVVKAKPARSEPEEDKPKHVAKPKPARPEPEEEEKPKHVAKPKPVYERPAPSPVVSQVEKPVRTPVKPAPAAVSNNPFQVFK